MDISYHMKLWFFYIVVSWVSILFVILDPKFYFEKQAHALFLAYIILVSSEVACVPKIPAVTSGYTRINQPVLLDCSTESPRKSSLCHLFFSRLELWFGASKGGVECARGWQRRFHCVGLTLEGVTWIQASKNSFFIQHPTWDEVANIFNLFIYTG